MSGDADRLNAAARIETLERAIRSLALGAYRDGATGWVAATNLDEAFALVGLPRVEGREVGKTEDGRSLSEETALPVGSIQPTLASRGAFRNMTPDRGRLSANDLDELLLDVVNGRFPTLFTSRVARLIIEVRERRDADTE